MLDLLAVAQSSSIWTMFDSTATVVGFVATVLAGLGWLNEWRRRRALKSTMAIYEKNRAKLYNDYEAAIAENEKLAKQRDDWMPSAWMELADKERASGNDAVAVDILDQGYQRVRGDLGLVAHQLAEFHASRMIGFDATQEHEAARRLSRVARELAPAQPDIADLADDLEAIEIVDGEPLQIAASRFDAADPQEAERVIRAVRTANRRLFAQGRYRTCIVLTRRAARLARRHNLDRTEIGLSSGYDLSEALLFGGHHTEAFAEISELLPLQVKVLGKEHPLVLATRHLKAQALSDLGRYDDALSDISELLSLQVKVLGKEHPHVVTTRGLKAQALSYLGRYDDALSDIVELLPLEEKVLGKEHPTVLTTRFLKAQVLSNLGRYDDALSNITELLPLQEKVLSKEHPYLFVTQRLHAEIQLGLGQTQTAFETIEPAIGALTERLGPNHYSTLTSELVRLTILVALDRRADARVEIDRVHNALLAASGPGDFRFRQAAKLRDELGG